MGRTRSILGESLLPADGRLKAVSETTKESDLMKWQVGLYAAAVLIPLAAFAIELIFIRQLKRLCAYLATGAIGLSFLLSLVGFVDYYYYAIEAEGVWAEHHAEAEPGTIVQVLQHGYTIKDRLLRPAMVAVAKKPD